MTNQVVSILQIDVVQRLDCSPFEKQIVEICPFQRKHALLQNLQFFRADNIPSCLYAFPLSS